MQELKPGLYHWITLHDRIKALVSSYYAEGTGEAYVIDPRVPDEGLEWFASRPQPRNVYLTNRHHYRHSDQFAAAFGAAVWCEASGLHEFTKGEPVRGFAFGEELPGGLRALEVGSICSEETALYLPQYRALALADAVICHRPGGELDFVPDQLLGDDPGTVKQGVLTSLDGLLALDFDTLLFAHGDPVVGGGKEALRDFIQARQE